MNNMNKPLTLEGLLVLARQKNGDLAELRAFAAASISPSYGRDARALVDFGILLRDNGLFEEADRVLRHILADDEQFSFAHYELAISHLLRGRHADALVHALAILRYFPGDHRAALLSARLFQGLGAKAAAAEQLCVVARSDVGEATRLMQFGEFLDLHPRGVADLLALQQEMHPAFVGVSGVVGSIRAALDEKRGFSLIRLGDGEGAFMKMSPEEEARFAQLYATNRVDRANVWFAGEIDIFASGFLDTALHLSEVVSCADIVGIPYRSWVEHEYNILSSISISTLVNVLRTIHATLRSGQGLCRQDIHMALLNAGELGRLLNDQAEVGLISCHPSLPARLQETFGIHEVEFHKLPGEKLMRDVIGDEAAAGRHFPDVFQAVMSALDRPLNGKLFLVAGGLLGKFYCSKIKDCGGVAIDVGSVVDAWIGANTRPGFSEAGLL